MSRRANESYAFRISARPAFTLVEMMVVIVVILLLVGLTAVGVSKVVSNQRASNTETAIRTIQKTLNAHWAAVVNDAKRETGLSVPFQTMDSPFLFGPDTTGGERDRVIWIKMRLMEAFPVNFTEIQNPLPYRTNIIPPNLRKYNSTYQSALSRMKQLNPKIPHLSATESSACLLMALSVTRNGTSLNTDNMGSINVADTDFDNIPEFVDSWGSPLTFYRFPTDNQALQATSPANAKFADPLDPGGALFTWPLGAKRTSFDNAVHRIASPFGNAACYIVPTIVSWGPNGNILHVDPIKGTYVPYGLGLDAHMAVAPVDPEEEVDNIYSFALR